MKLSFFDRLFPHRNIHNIFWFYVLTAVYNSWIVAGVWVFIWGAFLTKTQIGISDAITFTLGLLIELPSGVFADIIGRRKAIIIGNILLTIGNLFVGLSSGFLSITFWYLLWTIGYAFQSGATEAHAYDSLKEAGQEDKWKDVIATATTIGKATALICTALGGYLFVLGFRLPYLVTALISSIGIIAAIKMKETNYKIQTTSWSAKEYLSQIKDGVQTLLQRNIFPTTLISLSVISIGYMYNWGLIRPLTGERFGFTPTSYSLLLATTSLATIIAISFLRKIQTKYSAEKLIFVITFMYCSLFFSLGFSHSWFVGGLIMVGLSVGLSYTDIIYSQYINTHTKSQHRATTLSAIALFTKLPYVLLVVVIGKLAETNQLPMYLFIVSAVAFTLWGVSKTLSLQRLR